jgi:hypothetical protein
MGFFNIPVNRIISLIVYFRISLFIVYFVTPEYNSFYLKGSSSPRFERLNLNVGILRSAVFSKFDPTMTQTKFILRWDRMVLLLAVGL